MDFEEVKIIADALNKYHGPVGGFERIDKK